MSERARFTSHEEYIAAAPAAVQEILLLVQQRVALLFPQAQRCISYGIPAFRDGKVFFYFAGFKNHLGVYPPVKGDAALIAESAAYRNEKGNLTFRYSDPLPYELIGRVAMALHREYANKSAVDQGSRGRAKPGASKEKT